MSSSQPLSSSDDDNDQTRDLNSAYTKFKHNAALCMLVGAPILIAIPPRKLDLYTFSLGAAFVASVNQLTVERTGRGLISQLGYKYRFEYQTSSQTTPTVLEGGRRLLEEEGRGDVRTKGGSLLEGKVKQAWMRDKASADNWKQERLKEEQEKLNEGEGYGDMIIDQIWDVWNQQGKRKKDQEEKEK